MNARAEVSPYVDPIQRSVAQHLGMWKEANLVSPYCFRHKNSKPCKVRQSYMP